MIAVDTNILVYAHRAESVWHARAAARIEQLANGSSRWGMPWPCLHEFLGVVTHPRVMKPPTPLAIALGQVDAWRAAPGIEMLGEQEGYWNALRALVSASQVAGPKVHDAHIAALCLEHRVTELWSADRDFSRFPGLRVVNPLA